MSESPEQFQTAHKHEKQHVIHPSMRNVHRFIHTVHKQALKVLVCLFFI